MMRIAAAAAAGSRSENPSRGGWTSSKAMLLWMGVLATAILCLFVHLLETQIARGERLRQAQRSGVSHIAQKGEPDGARRRPLQLAGH